MRSILEKAILHLLNEDQEKAEALFHKFMVAKAREIHESIRQGDEVVLNEGWDDEIVSEEYFSEGDLDDAVEDNEEDAEVDMDAADADEADAVDHEVEADDLSGEMGEEEPEIAERMADIEDQIESLHAEFEAMMAEIEGNDDAEDVDGDLVDRMSNDVTTDDDASDEASEDAADGEDDEYMDDAEDITESVLAELEKVSLTLTDGKGIGSDGTVSAGSKNKSPVPGQNANNRGGATPVKTAKGGHTGYDREPSPAVKEVKAKNSRKSAFDGTSSVSKEGDKDAALNKDFAGSKNTKSAID